MTKRPTLSSGDRERFLRSAFKAFSTKHPPRQPSKPNDKETAARP